MVVTVPITAILCWRSPAKPRLGTASSPSFTFHRHHRLNSSLTKTPPPLSLPRPAHPPPWWCSFLWIHPLRARSLALFAADFLFPSSPLIASSPELVNPPLLPTLATPDCGNCDRQRGQRSTPKRTRIHTQRANKCKLVLTLVLRFFCGCAVCPPKLWMLVVSLLAYFGFSITSQLSLNEWHDSVPV